MNIEHISYFIPEQAQLISDLCQQNELSKEEAHVFSRIMGLKQVSRDSNQTSFDNIKSVLTLFLNPDEFILIVNADTAFTDVVKSIPGCTVMGDAASVVLLSNHGGAHELIDLELHVDDRFHHGVFGSKDEKLLFQSIYNSTLCDIIEQIMARNQLSLSQLKFIFPHNVNHLSWRSVSQRTGF